jgi:ABC-type glycerol-3-phosphate transport system permease component
MNTLSVPPEISMDVEEVLSQKMGRPVHEPGQRALRPGKMLGTAVLAIIIAIVITIFLAPFLWMLFGGMRPQSDLFNYIYPFQWHTIIPTSWTLNNYIKVIRDGFGDNFINSLIVAFGQVPLSILIDSMAAYSITWLPMPKKNLVFGFLMGMMIVPIMSIVIPMYLVVVAFNMQNTYAAMIVPFLAHVFGIFLFRQFLMDLPVELADAALVDGASPFQIYWQIMMPNILPAVVTTGLVYFMWVWNSFLWPLIAVQDRSLQVIQVAVASYINPENTDWGLLFAAASMASIPVILLFLALQRQYIEGIARTGIKG